VRSFLGAVPIMELPPDFDYHLPLREQEQVERIVPLTQAKIHLGFRALVVYNSKTYPDAAVALSEHMVTLCCRGFLGTGLRLLATVHLLAIRALCTENDQTTIITLDDLAVTVVTPVCMRFARNLLRNFLLSAPMMPPHLRFRLEAHDMGHFPVFNPMLSPSQNFQFTYNANCSYYDTTYHHDVARYFHHQILTENGLFDFNQLPIHLVESGLGETTDVRAITTSFCFCPYIYGLCCENITMHGLVRASASVVLMNSNLELLRLVKVGAEDGCKELATALYENPESAIVYWDLSDNKMEDISYLAQAFGAYLVRIRSLRFTNCAMDTFDLQVLLQSLLMNSCLHTLEHLCISGNKMTQGHCQQLSNWMARATSLVILEFGPASHADSVVKSVPPFLEALKIEGSSLLDGSVAELVQRTTALQELDISGCVLTDAVFLGILDGIAGNATLREIRLKLNRLKLRGSRLVTIFEFFTQNEALQPKITELSLTENGLSLEDFRFLLPILQSFPRLAKVTLSGNFSEKIIGIGSEIAKLLQISHLESIILRDCHLGEQAHFIISALFNNDTLHELDLTNNDIRATGIAMLTTLIRTNPSIRILALDGANPDQLQCILDFLDAVAQNNTLVQVPYPMDDIYEKLADLPEEPRMRSYDVLTHLQGMAERKLAQNRAQLGFFSGLALLRDKVLNSWFDSITLELHQKLIGQPVGEHRAVTRVVGLPFPYEDELSVAAQPVSSPEVGTDPYVEPQMMAVVEDPGDISGLKTLQFNSLLIRRPDAAERLQRKVQTFTMPTAVTHTPTAMESFQLDDSEAS
jgi:Ran GTPase-activating protein (RanGAP) involved in mRNA processing and transport